MTSNHYCCVPQCRSWAKRDPDRKLSFHLFPKPHSSKVYLQTKTGKELVDRREAWIIKLSISKPITKYSKVCSLHFQKDDYFHKGELTGSRGRELKKTAVPSQNLPSNTMLSQTLTSHGQREKNPGPAKIRRYYFTGTDLSLCTNGDGMDEKKAEIQAAIGLMNLLNSRKRCNKHNV